MKATQSLICLFVVTGIPIGTTLAQQANKPIDRVQAAIAKHRDFSDIVQPATNVIPAPANHNVAICVRRNRDEAQALRISSSETGTMDVRWGPADPNVRYMLGQPVCPLYNDSNLRVAYYIPSQSTPYQVQVESWDLYADGDWGAAATAPVYNDNFGNPTLDIYYVAAQVGTPPDVDSEVKIVSY